MANRALAKQINSSPDIAPFTASYRVIPAASTTHLLAQSAPSSQLEQINQYNQAPTASPTNPQLQQINQYSQAPTTPIAQVTSVSQLSDVQPTDWAFQALQSLVERYGCIAGYPDGTYRGNRALTRYEFAAGLNACLDRVNELIAAGTSDLVRKEDLATLQRLQEEFAAELATLRGRVDSIEARTAQLEANQFSTTTKLAGEVILAANGVGNSNGGSRAVVSGRRRGSAGQIRDNETFTDRVRLVLNTSFTGKDLLRTRLNARNNTPFNVGVTGTNETRLGFDGDEGNTVFVDQLFYRFPLAKNAIIQIDAANVELGERGFPTFSPFESSSLGSISRYGRFSPIYRAGNSGLNNGNNSVLSSSGAGASIHLNPQGIVGLDLAYLAPNSNSPASGFGITNGSYAAV
ncbi:MAG: carbohydrate porin, partial [Chroococcidiopsidaceae cyanobacterium CP_BM_ER_R8_30]|nr:carbohydrate porin [Chroococcidiopsidaceae cyanobacterium CP_BM_ER_R8_30]